MYWLKSCTSTMIVTHFKCSERKNIPVSTGLVQCMTQPRTHQLYLTLPSMTGHCEEVYWSMPLVICSNASIVKAKDTTLDNVFKICTLYSAIM